MRLKNQKWRFSEEPTAFFSGLRTNRIVKFQSPIEPVLSEEEQEFISAKTAAKWLDVPLRSFNQYVQQGLLPSYKLGRHRLFRKSQIVEALGANFNTARSAIFR